MLRIISYTSNDDSGFDTLSGALIIFSDVKCLGKDSLRLSNKSI